MQETSLTQGPIGKSLLRFSIPVIFSMLTTQLYTIVDTMIVGLKLDANALAAVSNGATLLMFFLFISGGMELGGLVMIASKHPIYTKEQLSRMAYNLLAVDVAIGLLMLGIGVAIFRPLLLLINTPEEIVTQALLYGTIYLLGVPFQMVYDLSRQMLIGYGNSRIPMYFVIATSVLNILLDLVLVDLWGVGGAAAASALAQIAGCVGLLWWLRGRLLIGRFSPRLMQLDYLKDMVRLVPPYTIQQMSGAIITSIKQSLLGTLGVAAIAGFSCANKLSTFLLLPLYASCQSLVTFIAQNQALGQTERIREGIRVAYRLLFALTVGLAAICALGSHTLLRLFTTDTSVIALGAMLLTWESLTYPLSVFRHINEARLRGQQRMLLYLVSSLSTIAISALACLFLVPQLGFTGFIVSSYICVVFAILLSSALVRIANA